MVAPKRDPGGVHCPLHQCQCSCQDIHLGGASYQHIYSASSQAPCFFNAPSQSELFNLLENEELAKVPILVLANKQVGVCSY